MMLDIRAIFDDTQDATHCMITYHGMWKLIEHKAGNKNYISDEPLLALELCIYQGTTVQVHC